MIEQLEQLRTSNAAVNELLPNIAGMAFDNLPFGAFSVDMELGIVAWNKGMESLTSVPAHACFGQNVAKVLREKVRHSECLFKTFKTLLEQCDQVDCESLSLSALTNPVSLTFITHPEMTYSLFSTPVWDASGHSTGMMCLLMDFCIQDARCAANDFYKRLLTLSPGMAYQILNDGKWTINYVSEGCENLTGHSQEHFLGKSFSVWVGLIHPEDETKALSEFHKSIAENRPFRQEFRIIDASGNEKWILNQGRPVFTSCRELSSVEAYMCDMTSYKEQEQHLRTERKLLRSALRDNSGFGNIIGQSPAMHKVYDLIINAALSEDSVFITGETGTGKELVARAVHDNSARCNGPFVAVNCGAIPETLIEAEFFGHKKGAFTGASQDKPGFIESAAGGTLFLDEIGEISLSMQVKLLRALETSGFTPVGGSGVVRPDVRIIAASNKNLTELVETGLMRRDFFYRIYVIPILLPPLRDRTGDIVLLVDHLLEKIGGQQKPKLSKAEYELLKAYSWPGNVRELQNAIRRYLTLGDFDFIREVMDCDQSFSFEEDEVSFTAGGDLNLKDVMERVEKKLILTALKNSRWHKINAASLLGVSRRTLFRKIKEFGLSDMG